jgi:hypothetical protein
MLITTPLAVNTSLYIDLFIMWLSLNHYLKFYKFIRSTKFTCLRLQQFKTECLLALRLLLPFN